MSANNKNDQFEKYLKSTSTSDIYQNIHCAYCDEQDFNAKYRHISKENVDLSILHLNIRSLNANSSKLVQMLSMLDLKFDLIVLSEIWTYNINFYSNILSNYTFIYDLPILDVTIGGVGMYISNKIKYRLNPVLKITTDAANKVESLWVEVDKGNKHYIIGGIYRHPNQNIIEFQHRLDTTLQKIKMKNNNVLVIGDINIDLLKYNDHKDTSAYIDSLMLHNLLPLSLLPTRVTEKSHNN